MKKIIAFLILICIFMSSCSAKVKSDITTSDDSVDFRVLEVGGYDADSDAKHQMEVNLNESYFKNASLKGQSKTIEKDGLTYEADYRESINGYLYQSNLDCYEKRDDEKAVSFRINCDTGKLDFFYIYDKYYLDHVTSPELSREECLQIAKEYFGQYTSSVSDYELVWERNDYTPTYRANYTFEFARMIDGVKTSDHAFIYVTVFGDVRGHIFLSLGSMENATLPSSEKMEKIEQAVDEKLASIFSEKEYSVEKKDIIFSRLSDGGYALEYELGIKIHKHNPEQSYFEELTRLIVHL